MERRCICMEGRSVRMDRPAIRLHRRSLHPHRTPVRIERSPIHSHWPVIGVRRRAISVHRSRSRSLALVAWPRIQVRNAVPVRAMDGALLMDARRARAFRRKRRSRPKDTIKVLVASKTITVTTEIHFTTTSHPWAAAHCAVIHTIKRGSLCTLAFLVDVFFLHTQSF